MQTQPEQSVVQTATFELKGIWLNRALFEHVARVKPHEGEVKPQNVHLNMMAGVSIKMLNDSQAKVSMGMTITPDPKWHPYKVEVEMDGIFLVVNGTRQELDHFCRNAAPTILYPYIREVISRLTADGKYGVVRLNPMNVPALMASAEWTEEQPTASTEQQRPSSPSRSASPDSKPAS